MRIFRLERVRELVDWEELMNVTVIAHNEMEARMRAYTHFKELGHEYAPELLDPDKCRCMGVPFTNGIIAMEFK